MFPDMAAFRSMITKWELYIRRRKRPYNTATSHVWKFELTPEGSKWFFHLSFLWYGNSNPRGLWGFLSCSLACQRWVLIATWNFFRIGACCPYAGPLISRIYKMPWLLGVQRRSSMASLNIFWCLDITVRLLTSCYLPSLVIMSRKTWDLPKPINRSDRFFWGSP